MSERPARTNWDDDRGGVSICPVHGLVCRRAMRPRAETGPASTSRPSEGWLLDETRREKRMRRFNDRGELITRYRWPRGLPSVDSRLLSWENLDLCGGWQPVPPADDGVTPLERVLAGLKPVGVGYHWQGTGQDASGSCEASRRRRMEALAKRGIEAGFVTERWTTTFGGARTSRGILLAIDALFGELFDLDAVAHLYDTANLEVADEIPSLTERPVASGWTWAADPETDLELAAMGLALGYPIESTIAILRDTR